MKIYHYHPVTGQYIASGTAHPDPLVEGNWLIPAHATNIEPPQADEGKIVVFDQVKNS